MPWMVVHARVPHRRDTTVVVRVTQVCNERLSKFDHNIVLRFVGVFLLWEVGR